MTEQKKVIGLFGIGIFTYLSISGISYSLQEFSKGICSIIGLEPKFTFWISELLSTSIFILLIYFTIKKISDNYSVIVSKIVTYFIWSFVIFIITQLIQMVYPSIKYIFLNDGSSDTELAYFEYLGKNYHLYFIQSALYYFEIIIAFIFIYGKLKNSQQQHI